MWGRRSAAALRTISGGPADVVAVKVRLPVARTPRPTGALRLLRSAIRPAWSRTSRSCRYPLPHSTQGSNLWRSTYPSLGQLGWHYRPTSDGNRGQVDLTVHERSFHLLRDLEKVALDRSVHAFLALVEEDRDGDGREDADG